MYPPPHVFSLSKIILTTTLALSLILTLSFTSCKSGDGDGPPPPPPGNGGTITGDINGCTITGTVKYDSDITDLADAKRQTNFSYFDDDVPISDYIPNSSITISNGNITIKLGKPKDDFMDYIYLYMEDGITVSDNSAKAPDMVAELFHTQDAAYRLFCVNADGTKDASLIYVTKDVTITGTYTNSSKGYTDNYNVSFKAGWNYLIWTCSGTEDNEINTYTASQSLPEDFYWTVFDD